MATQAETLTERRHLNRLFLHFSDTFVAPETEIGYGLMEELVGRGTVRIMALGTETEFEGLHLRLHREELGNRLVATDTKRLRSPLQQRLNIGSVASMA